MGVSARRLVAALATPGMIAAACAGEGELRVEAEVDTARPYVQSQLLYTARLYQAIPLEALEFHPPAAALAEVRPLGETRVGDAEISGRRYRVTERRYAIFPFASGALTLQPARITARGRGQAHAVSAPPLTVDVRPASTAASSWLPARALSLSAADHGADALPLGEALRYTVRIEAQGLEAAQLPAPQIHGPGFTAQALPPRLANHLGEDGVTGVREQTWLVIPRDAGTLTVPGIALPWHDTATDTPRLAQLPPRTIHVRGSAPAPLPPAPAAAPATRAEPRRNTANTGPWIAVIGALTLAALAALVPALSAHRRNAPLRIARRACRRHQAREAHDALLQWGRTLSPQLPPNLHALGRHLGDPALAAELARLDRSRFGKAADWDGAPLLSALRRHLHAKRKERLRLGL